MKYSKSFSNNDIYFMEVVSDKVIINNNYDGVTFLDSDLNVLKDIKLLDDLIIDISFKHDSGIVLCCYDNQCIIYINTETYTFKIIPLPEDFEKISFLSLYEWEDNDLVLLADNGTVTAHVNLLDDIVKVIKKDSIGRHRISIHENWDKLCVFLIHKIYPDKHIAVVETNNTIMMMDYKNNTRAVLKMEPIKFHDIEVTTDYIVQVSEDKASIMCGDKNVILYPDSRDHRFLRGKFITIDKKDYLLLLVCSNADSSEANIEKHSLLSIANGNLH